VEERVDLLRDEQIIYQGRPSPRASIGFFVRWGILGLMPAAVATYLWTRNDSTWLSLADWWGISALLIVALIIRNAAYRRSFRFTVTSQRIVIRSGIVARTEHATTISRIQNVTIRQSILQRLLGIGDVEFDTAGGDLNEADFALWGSRIHNRSSIGCNTTPTINATTSGPPACSSARNAARPDGPTVGGNWHSANAGRAHSATRSARRNAHRVCRRWESNPHAPKSQGV
jgi:membrane protein YdbS with pleckstrin-like domain